ncbi:hypothetical protein JQN08_14235 [Phocaeicola dorei]|nr:hypothetical protein [Phocaeicola dorei]MBT1308395.1 hypothetical protein [Phocaeicola dorei]
MNSRFLSYGAEKDSVASRLSRPPPLWKPAGRVRHGDEKEKIPTGNEVE